MTETLDVNRSKHKAALITIINTKVLDTLPYLFYGALTVIIGIIVYYGLPLSLLELNASLILTIFFILLFGMLLGLVLIATNLQPFLEQALIYVVLFWEKHSMRAVLRKNMVSHRKKNRLTAIVYALALGCIIFLITSADLQISLIQDTTALPGADIEVTGSCIWDDK